mmetsp:Transcript_72395/g.169626  ORF Transcript_72395/g.169626 Transcript_72395/m.169626 type:complete len:347 (-) Transcript_72395:1251-2291(-)
MLHAFVTKSLHDIIHAQLVNIFPTLSAQALVSFGSEAFIHRCHFHQERPGVLVHEVHLAAQSPRLYLVLSFGERCQKQDVQHLYLEKDGPHRLCERAEHLWTQNLAKCHRRSMLKREHMPRKNTTIPVDGCHLPKPLPGIEHFACIQLLGSVLNEGDQDPHVAQLMSCIPEDGAAPVVLASRHIVQVRCQARQEALVAGCLLQQISDRPSDDPLLGLLRGQEPLREGDGNKVKPDHAPGHLRFRRQALESIGQSPQQGQLEDTQVAGVNPITHVPHAQGGHVPVDPSKVLLFEPSETNLHKGSEEQGLCSKAGASEQTLHSRILHEVVVEQLTKLVHANLTPLAQD